MRKSNQPSRNAKSHGNQKRPEFRNFHLPPLRRGEKKGPGISDVYAKVSLASLRPVAIPGLRHAVDITRVTRTQLLPLWSYCISSGFFCVKEGNSSVLNTTHLLPERCVPGLEPPCPFTVAAGSAYRHTSSAVENSGQSLSLDGRLFRSMAATVTGERTSQNRAHSLG